MHRRLGADIDPESSCFARKEDLTGYAWSRGVGVATSIDTLLGPGLVERVFVALVKREAARALEPAAIEKATSAQVLKHVLLHTNHSTASVT
jgi:hypothetical protein